MDVVAAPPSIAAVAPQGGAREELRPRAGDEGSAFAAALSGALRQDGAERPKESVRQRAAESGAPAAGQPEEDRTVDEVAMAVVAALGSPESPQLPAGPTAGGSVEAGGAAAGLAAQASAVAEDAAATSAPVDGAEPAAGQAGATAAAPRDALSELDPLFRSRLERVRSRMEAEFGHKVEIVEGYRDQARQDVLYAQGRTRPGPIVTWTRNSLHTEGRAADVRIDGSYDNLAAYERLAQVAREEGLRTLWPKDPGHIELPRESPARTGAAATGGEDALARVARVATVAQVARPAEPAAVSPAVPAAPGMAAQAGAGGAASSSAPAGAGLDAAVRVSELLEITSVASARPRSHVLLDVRDADGKPTRIRVDLRGAALAATIDAADPAAAERLASRLGELHRALERQGVENAMLRVRTQAQASVEALRPPTRAGESLASSLATLLPRVDAAAERRPAGSDAPFQQPTRDPQADPHRSRRDQRQERTS